MDDEERYGLNWPGKRLARELALTPPVGTLAPRPDESLDWDRTRNLMIEGDNLEVLKLLQADYAGKVRLIYIDPPYNTGKAFTYSDGYGQGWLSMMYPRLMLARTLLAEDGVIVSHIDEHELAHLLLLMAQVFGEENRLGVIVWDKLNPKGDARGLSYQHEHIVLWSRNIAKATGRNALRRTKKNAAEMLARAAKLFADHKRGKATLEEVNAKFGAWLRTQPFSGGERAYSRIDEDGEVYQAVSMAWPNKKPAPPEYFIPLRHPVTGEACPVPERGWRNPPETMARLAAAGEIVFGHDHTTQPRRKYRLSDNLEENLPSILTYGGSDDALLSALGIPFDHPKPLKVACEMVALARDDDDIVLDFFAGSGTTGHAVMALNAADGKARRYILVQLPEPLDPAEKSQKAAADLCDSLARPRTIAELTKERLRRAAARIRAQHPDTPADLGFRAYRLEPFLSRPSAAN